MLHEKIVADSDFDFACSGTDMSFGFVDSSGTKIEVAEHFEEHTMTCFLNSGSVAVYAIVDFDYHGRHVLDYQKQVEQSYFD